MILPTVRIHHPDDPSVMMIINERDLTDQHVPWGTSSSPPSDLRVGKGPRGKWYAKRGKDVVAGPFDTEAEAVASQASP